MNTRDAPDFTIKLNESEQLASFIRKFQPDEEFTRAFYAEGNKYGAYTEEALRTLLQIRKMHTQTQITKP